jgi:Toprim domain-containing protein
MTASLQELATLLGGDVNGVRVSCPGPGHSASDRSLSVTPAKNDDGFTVHSFSPRDDRAACVVHVKSLLDPEKRAALAALGSDLPARDDKSARELAEGDPLAKGWYSRSLAPKVEGAPRAEEERRRRIERAQEIWDACVSPAKTIVELYLWKERHLDLTADICGSVIRYHPECPWGDKPTGRVFRAPCMVAAMRSIETDEIVAIQRTRLSPVGQKIDRRMLGPAAGAAIKLDDDDAVTHGLAIAEGVETAMTARQLGLMPVWALGSAGAIAALSPLAGIQSLTILGEHDDASAKAMHACAQCWHAAGHEILINQPIGGKDLNDSWRGIA